MSQCKENITGEIMELARFSEGYLLTCAVLTILIMIVGILGNSLTIVALLQSPKIRNVAASFILSLCITDLIFCILVLPFSASRFINRGWIHGDFLCTMFPFITYGNLGVSLLSIALITINRYIMITNNGIYSTIYKPKWIGFMIGSCWCFSFLMQFPTLFGLWGKFGYDEKLQTCTIVKDQYGRTSKNALFVIAFIIPCCIIIFCYTKIFWTVHKSENRLRRHSTSNDSRELKTKRNEWRITKMVLVIFVSFLICYLPITIVKLTDSCVHYPVMHLVGYILIYLSSCINPIIYVFMNKQYRQAFKAVIFSGTLWSDNIHPRVSYQQQSNRSKIADGRDLNSQTITSQMSITTTNSNSQFITVQFSPNVEK